MTKTIFKTTLCAASVVCALLVGATAFAQQGKTTQTKPKPQMNLTIGPAGQVDLAGTIVSLDAKSIVVKSWGGNWNINLPTGASTSNMAVGDAVRVTGKANTTSSWTVDAKKVQDDAMKQRVADAAKAKKNGKGQQPDGTANGTKPNGPGDGGKPGTPGVQPGKPGGTQPKGPGGTGVQPKGPGAGQAGGQPNGPAGDKGNKGGGGSKGGGGGSNGGGGGGGGGKK